MATIELNTADQWRKNWEFFTPDQIAAWVKAGELSMDFHATGNQEVVYRTYAGEVGLRVIYRAFGEVVSPPDSGWIKLPMKPETAHMITGLILQQEPTVLGTLIALNGGTMPDIKPPIIPDPVVVPEPEPDAEPAPDAEPDPEIPIFDGGDAGDQ